MGATFGVDTLRGLGHRVIGLSGRLARSPLAAREAELATGLRVYTPWELQAGALVEYVASEAQAVAPTAALRPSAQMINGPGPAPNSAAWHAVLRPTSSLAPVRSGSGLDQRLCREVLAITAAKVLAHEADAFAGAPRGARASQRRTRRSGYRRHHWATCFGEIDIAVPRFRKGSFRSAFLLAPKADPNAVQTAIRETATTRCSSRLLRLLGSPPLPERSVEALGAEIARRYSASTRMAVARRADKVRLSKWRSGRHGPPTSMTWAAITLMKIGSLGGEARWQHDARADRGALLDRPPIRQFSGSRSAVSARRDTAVRQAWRKCVAA